MAPVMPLVALLDEEGQMTGITCPLNVGVDPHDIEGCEDLLESYFMQVGPYSSQLQPSCTTLVRCCLLCEILFAFKQTPCLHTWHVGGVVHASTIRSEGSQWDNTHVHSNNI